jgi:Arc/MetJ-type ribon-helix-helix transcriptional regulator
MTIQLTPEQSKSIQKLVQTGAYRDEIQVIDEALDLLKSQQELRARVNAGVQQLDQGEYRTYQAHERQRFLDDIEAASRARRASSSEGPA